MTLTRAVPPGGGGLACDRRVPAIRRASATSSPTTSCSGRRRCTARRRGANRTTAYLAAALVVLGPTLRYVHQWYAEDSAVLEFEAELGGLTVHGVDILRWNADDRLVEFTVMVRPLRGLQHLVTLMAAQLERS